MDKETIRAEIDQLLDSFSVEKLIETKELIEEKSEKRNSKILSDDEFDKITNRVIEENDEVLNKLSK